MLRVTPNGKEGIQGIPGCMTDSSRRVHWTSGWGMMNYTLKPLGLNKKKHYREEKGEYVWCKGLAPKLNHQIKCILPSLRDSKHVEETAWSPSSEITSSSSLLRITSLARWSTSRASYISKQVACLCWWYYRLKKDQTLSKSKSSRFVKMHVSFMRRYQQHWVKINGKQIKG